MNPRQKDLAINGGVPVTGKLILIHKPYIDEADCRAAYEAVQSTFVSGDGPACRKFEEKLAKYLNVKHVLFTSSCTTA